MAERSPGEELWKRTYEPISDWKPARSQSSSVIGGAFNEVYKAKESLTKLLEPLSEETKEKVKEVARIVEDLAGRSSREARALLAKTLETIADKIKPG